MCNKACIDFGKRMLLPADVRGKSVLEVGAFDVNGSFRGFVTKMKPASYLGVDIVEGPCVDELCDACALVDRFGENAFDVVISTEMLEHVEKWQLAISNLKRVTRKLIVLTTRSPGFPYHMTYDYWRFTPFNMTEIFADFQIDAVERDRTDRPKKNPRARPGVFIKATKLADFTEVSLEDYKVQPVTKE
jgi:SAM-dependent methyltransferase